jgi:hypothetical protein
MPEILIRGMEMPQNCFRCPLFSNCDACEGHECGCGLLGGIGYEEDISEDIEDSKDEYVADDYEDSYDDSTGSDADINQYRDQKVVDEDEDL